MNHSAETPSGSGRSIFSWPMVALVLGLGVLVVLAIAIEIRSSAFKVVVESEGRRLVFDFDKEELNLSELLDRITSYSNPKDNADTERFLRTLKEEVVWPHEWTSPSVFFEALERWITTYNAGYLHSALGYRSPEAFEAEHLSHATPLAGAC
jgi:hypothetical protein